MPNDKNLLTPDKIIFWGLILIISLLPFIYTNRTFDLVLIKTVFFQLGLSLLFFIWFLKLANSEFIRIPKNPLLLPFVLFIFYAFLSALFSSYQYTSFQVFFSLLSYFLLFCLLIDNFKERGKICLISQIILIVAGVISLFSLYKNISVYKFDFWKHPIFYDFFGNPNFFAGYLVIIIPLSFSLFVYSHKKLEKLSLLFLSILLCLNLLLTHSQGAWLILFFYFLIFFTGRIINYWVRQEFLKGIVFALFPFVVLSVFYLLIIHTQIPIEKYLFPKASSLAIRLALWKSTWPMIKILPFRGWGIGTFYLYFPLYRTPESLGLVAAPIIFHAHNEFLELTAEMGILGLILFLWVISTILLSGLKLWRVAPLAWKKYPLGFSLGCLGILMDNLISPSLRWTAIGVYFWLGVGLLMSVRNMIFKEKGWSSNILLKNQLFPIFKSIRPGLLYGLALVLFFLLSIEIIEPYQAEIVLKNGVQALDEGNIPQAIMKFEEAKRINPYCFSAYYKLGHSYRLIGEFEEALKTYQNLEKMAPNYARLHYNLGCVYQDLGRFREAIDEFKIALKREDELMPHYRLQEIYSALGKNDLEEKEKLEIEYLQE